MKTVLGPMAFFIVLYFTSISFGAGEFSISTLANLSFGKLATNGSGSVTLTPAGSRSSSGAVVILASGGGSPARFQITGEANRAFILTLPINGEVTLVSETNFLTLTDFTISPSAVGALSASGDQSLFFGATLNIDSQKPAGDYSGTFSFTIDYQ